MFTSVMKASYVPHLDILGGDYLFWKCVEFMKLPEDVSDIDQQMTFNLLCLCSGYCKMVHLTRSTPPPPPRSAATDSLKVFDLYKELLLDLQISPRLPGASLN